MPELQAMSHDASLLRKIQYVSGKWQTVRNKNGKDEERQKQHAHLSHYTYMYRTVLRAFLFYNNVIYLPRCHALQDTSQ